MELTSSEGDEARAYLREKADQSLYVFSKGVLQFPDLCSPLHNEMAEVSGNDSPHKRKLILIPRGHFKTTVNTISNAAWRACKDPNTRILISNATATNAAKMLHAIQLQFENNALLQLLYPEVIPNFRKVRWNSSMLELKRTMDWPEATIECIGVGGKVTSRHYNVQLKDDLINEDTPHTRDTLKAVEDWYMYSESLFIDPLNGIDIISGTRYWYDDLYGYIIENESIESGGNYFIYLRKVLENGEPIFPTRFTHAAVALLKRKQKPYIFSCQYYNEPIDDESAVIKSSWVRWKPEQEFPAITSTFNFVRVDLAGGESESGGDVDDTVLTAGAIDWQNNLWIWEVIMGHFTPIDTFEHMIYLNDKYNPLNIGVEAVAMQKALMPVWDYMSEHEEVQLPIIPITRGADSDGGTRIPRSKFLRILGCIWRFQHNKIFFNADMDTKVQEKILHQMLKYPKSKRDDFLDTLADFELETSAPQQEVKVKQLDQFSLENVKRMLASARAGKGMPGVIVHGFDRAGLKAMLRVPKIDSKGRRIG